MEDDTSEGGYDTTGLLPAGYNHSTPETEGLSPPLGTITTEGTLEVFLRVADGCSRIP